MRATDDTVAAGRPLLGVLTWIAPASWAQGPCPAPGITEITSLRVLTTWAWRAMVYQHAAQVVPKIEESWT